MTDTATFLQLTFGGGRFEHHTVPVAVLAELPTVQDVIEQVARHLFFLEHRDRSRVPRGFMDAAQLHLKASEPNCFTAELSQPDAASWFTYRGESLFARARDISVAALLSAAQDGPLPDEFPTNALEALAAIGRRLRDNESILVRAHSNASPARVDQTSRARLAAIAHRPLERDAELDGEVDGIDDPRNVFFVRLSDRERVEVPFRRQQRSQIIDALQYRPMARIRVRGRLLTANPQPRFKSVEELEIFDDERATDVLKMWDRIDSLRNVQDGWLDGDGFAPASSSLERAREILARLLVDHHAIPRPKLFPTPDGSVQAEWVFGNWAVDLKFDPEDLSLLAEATNAETSEERQQHFAGPVVSRDDVTALAEWLSFYEESARTSV